MKSNKEKLIDAIGMLDEETVATAMADTSSKAVRTGHSALMRRRAAVLLAASLALTLVLGALFAIPLMTADEPMLPETQQGLAGGTGQITPPTSDVAPGHTYTEVPLVRLTQLTASGSDVSNTPAIARDIPHVNEVSGYGFWTFLVLSFDCEVGEYVTVTATTDSLHLVEMPFDEDTDQSMGGSFMKRLWNIYDTQEEGVRTLTIDPATSCIAVFMPRTRTELDEDTLTFTVQDEEDMAVGAGAVYMGTRYLLDSNTHLWYERCTITRASVLGSVRFDHPEAYTEEHVTELLTSFTAKVEETKAALDYTPATMEERFAVAQAEIAETVFADEIIYGGSRSRGNFRAFMTVKVSETDSSEKNRGFLILADGTWGEFSVHDECISSQCHGSGCPMGAGGDSHHALMPGCRIRMLDGRIFVIAEMEVDGKAMYVPVEITKAEQ